MATELDRSGMPHAPLQGRLALVTGAAGGLGRAMTWALLRAGASVAGVDVHLDGLAHLRQQLAPGAAARLHVMQADLATPHGRLDLLASLCRIDAPVDILLNNAGIGLGAVREDYPTRPIRYWEIDGPTLERFLAVHTVAPYHLASALLPAMLDRGWGRVINVTTSLATMIRPGMSPYGGAKAATEAFTAMLAGDLAGSGVTANVLIPGGPVDTPILPSRPGVDRTRWLQADVMGPPAVWLCSAAADAINGRRVVAADCDPATGEPASPAGIAWPGHEGEVHWAR